MVSHGSKVVRTNGFRPAAAKKASNADLFDVKGGLRAPELRRVLQGIAAARASGDTLEATEPPEGPWPRCICLVILTPD